MSLDICPMTLREANAFVEQHHRVEGFVWKSLEGINAGEIGKTVFLTREEAEKTMEAME